MSKQAKTMGGEAAMKIPRAHPRTKDGVPVFIGSTLWYIGGLPEDAPVDSGVVRMIDGDEIYFEPGKRVKMVVASVTWSTRRAAALAKESDQ